MLDPTVTLVARLAASAGDARRGVVRLHPEVLDALGLRSWDAVTLTGARVTTALAASAGTGGPPGQATVDDVTLSNAGLTDGAAVVVTPARVDPARRVLLTGRYTPEVRGSRDADEVLVDKLRAGDLTAAELLARYSAMLHRRLGTYAEVAKRTGLDPRTTRKHVDSARSG